MTRPDITVSDAVRAYRKHGGIHHAAKALGCSPHTVQTRLKRAGVDSSQSRRDLPMDEIIAKYEGGQSARSLSIEYGYPECSLSNRLRECGVKTRTAAEAALARAGVRPTGDPNTKTCLGCKRELSLDAFHVANGGHKARRPRCIACEKARAREAKYGLTREQFEALWEDQGGKCRICRTKLVRKRHGKRAACVDHCHSNGGVRGLLCRRCNSAIGLLDDSPSRLRAAAKYLEQPCLDEWLDTGA